MPFVIHGKISFSPFVASPLKGKNPIPIPPNYGIKPFPGSEQKLISKLTQKEIPDFSAPPWDKILSHSGGGHHHPWDKILSHWPGHHHPWDKSYPTDVVNEVFPYY